MLELNSSHNYKVLGNFLANRLNFRSLQKLNNNKDHGKSRGKTRVKTTGNELQGELVITVTSGFSAQIHLKVCLGGTAFVRCRREKPLEPWDRQLLQEGSRQEKVTSGPEVSMWMWDDLLPSLTKGSDGISGGSVTWQSEIQTILVAPSRQLFWILCDGPALARWGWWNVPSTLCQAAVARWQTSKLKTVTMATLLNIYLEEEEAPRRFD